MQLNLKEIVDTSYIDQIKDMLLHKFGEGFVNKTYIFGGFVRVAIARYFGYDEQFSDIDIKVPFPLTEDDLEDMGFTIYRVFDNLAMTSINNVKVDFVPIDDGRNADFTVNKAICRLSNYKIEFDDQYIDDFKNRRIKIADHVYAKMLIRIALFCYFKKYTFRDWEHVQEKIYMKKSEFDHYLKSRKLTPRQIDIIVRMTRRLNLVLI